MKLVVNSLTGCVVPASSSGGVKTVLYHETDDNIDSQPIGTLPTAPYPSDVDVNGDLELSTIIIYPVVVVNDPYYELDTNGDIQQKAVIP